MKESPRGESDAGVSEQVVAAAPAVLPFSPCLVAVTKKYPVLLPEGRPPRLGDTIPAGSTLPLLNAVENTARGTRVGETHQRRDSSHRRSANDDIPDERSPTPESAVQQGSPKNVFDCYILTRQAQEEPEAVGSQTCWGWVGGPDAVSHRPAGCDSP